MAALTQAEQKEYEIRWIMSSLKPESINENTSENKDDKFTMDETKLLFPPQFDSMNPDKKFEEIDRQIEKIEDETPNREMRDPDRHESQPEMSQDSHIKHEKELQGRAKRIKAYWELHLDHRNKSKKKFIINLLRRREAAVRRWNDRNRQREDELFKSKHSFEQIKSDIEFFREKMPGITTYRPENSFHSKNDSHPQDVPIKEKMDFIRDKVRTSYENGIIDETQKNILEAEIDHLEREYIKKQEEAKRKRNKNNNRVTKGGSKRRKRRKGTRKSRLKILK